MPTPVVVVHYWVMPIAYQHRITVLDVSRPNNPREVPSLATDSTFFPHRSAADPLSDRIVVTERGDGARDDRARLDPKTGHLRWDDRGRPLVYLRYGAMRRTYFTVSAPATGFAKIRRSGNRNRASGSVV